jgi:hypothetical protein
VAAQDAVADVKRLVLHQEPDELAVGHVDHGLAVLGVAEAGLGVGQGPDLVKPAQVGAGNAGGLALVEIAPQPDVAVGHGEHGLALSEVLQVQVGLADRPGLDRVGRVLDHPWSSSSDRS